MSRDIINREILRAIIESPLTDLKSLARIAGGHPNSFFRGSDFNGADLRYEDLTGLDLTGSSFAGALFDHTTRIDEQFKYLLDGHLADAAVLGTALGASAPAWASDFGFDQHGLWASFMLQDQDGQPFTQRMRWIPPGRFRMGSPGDEPGRSDHEDPQHEVTIAAGFWLFDTPVTQAMWEKVVGANPSNFKDRQRPVEQVSFKQVSYFLARSNKMTWGRGLVLPSEAQWEYACRAGTETATYAGPIKIHGDCNAAILDSIAWYSENSGVDFDLPVGHDSSKWRDKQYPHTRAGTRKVAQKQPNQWGLYDMLGNVWEWSEYGPHDNNRGASADLATFNGVGTLFRVCRGGSWFCGGRDLRSASRSIRDPSVHRDDIGFRCARV